MTSKNRKLAIACLTISLLSAMALLRYRQWMAQVYPSVTMVSGSVYWLLFPLMLLPLLTAAFLAVRRQAVGLGPLILIAAFVLLNGAVALVPVLRYRDTGTLAQTIEKRISPQATIKKAGLIHRSGDYSLNEQQLEQLRELCRSSRVSTCLPVSAIRSEPISTAGKPRLIMIMDNPADRSKTYGVDIVFFSEKLAYLRFYQFFGSETELLYAVEGAELYQLIQDNLKNLQVP